MSEDRDLVFIGDVHLDRDDPALDDFLAFLDRLAGSCARVVLMGDLFNLWIGRRELEQPHQAAVVERLHALRRRGIVVRYVEGNRDYRIADGYAGGPLDDAPVDGLVESWGGLRLFAIHGDLVNVADRQYRSWRRLSRSRFFWALFNAVPRGRRLKLAEDLESRMRSTNLEHKAAFPADAVRAYARPLLDGGHDAVVLGHFHVEKDLPCGDGRVLVLPEWKGSRRHLRVSAGGEIAFVAS